MSSGGPAGLAYGFIIAWFCTMSVYLVIAELASMLATPTMGISLVFMSFLTYG